MRKKIHVKNIFESHIHTERLRQIKREEERKREERNKRMGVVNYTKAIDILSML